MRLIAFGTSETYLIFEWDQSGINPNYIIFYCEQSDLNVFIAGQPWWLSGLAPPSAQGMILETKDQSHIKLPAWSLLLPLPL